MIIEFRIVAEVRFKMKRREVNAIHRESNEITREPSL